MNDESISALVDDYREKHLAHLKALLSYFQKQESLRAAIERACFGHGEKINSHQRRVGRATLSLATIQLAKSENKLRACQSFDELYDLVEQTTARIDRFGELAVYDAALRLSAYLKILPRAIYLHAGTRKGCHALGVVGQDGKVATDQLPRPIRRLKAHEAEDFLCIYKAELKNGKGPATSCEPSTKRKRGGC